MKFSLMAVLIAGLALQTRAEDKKPAPENTATPSEKQNEPGKAPQSKEEKELWEKVSYAVGMNIASSWKAGGVDFNVDTVAQAIKDSTAGKTKITDQEAKEAITQWQVKIGQQQGAMKKPEPVKDTGEGAAFL